MSTISYGNYLTASEPHKALDHGFKREVGRNSQGKSLLVTRVQATSDSIEKLILCTTKRYSSKNHATVEYDPNRTGFIALAQYADGESAMFLCQRSIKVGDTFIVSEKADVKPGNRLTSQKYSCRYICIQC
jgi:large subunit ribosomal protein L2